MLQKDDEGGEMDESVIILMESKNQEDFQKPIFYILRKKQHPDEQYNFRKIDLTADYYN